MIVINYNGFKIECNSIEDAMKFVQASTHIKLAKKPKEVSTDNGTYPVVINRKKIGIKSIWTEQELSQLVNLLKEENTPGEISRDSMLRLRHTKGGIIQTINKFIYNHKKITSSPLVKKYVREYRESIA